MSTMWPRALREKLGFKFGYCEALCKINIFSSQKSNGLILFSYPADDKSYSIL